MIAATFEGETLACLVQARDSRGNFIKAIVQGKSIAFCEREDLSVTRFVARLEAMGMDVPGATPVRRPLDRTVYPVLHLLESELADAPIPAPRPH